MNKPCTIRQLIKKLQEFDQDWWVEPTKTGHSLWVREPAEEVQMVSAYDKKPFSVYRTVKGRKQAYVYTNGPTKHFVQRSPTWPKPEDEQKRLVRVK